MKESTLPEIPALSVQYVTEGTLIEVTYPVRPVSKK
jgi:hypothetical protein